MHRLLLFIAVLVVGIFAITSCTNKQTQQNQEQNFSAEKTSRSINKASDIWIDVTTSVADASQWVAYGSNTIEDVGDYVKITIVDNQGGGHFRFGNISTLPANKDDKNYKLTFTARVVNASANSVAILRNFYAWTSGSAQISDTEKTFEIYAPNTISYPKTAFIAFKDLPIGAEVYIKKAIKVEQMVERVYTQPNLPKKGAILNILPVPSNAEIDADLADFNSAGVKLIRLQVNPKRDIESLSVNAYLDKTVSLINDTFMPKLRALGMKAIVCIEGIPTVNPAYAEGRLSPGIWEDPETKVTFALMGDKLGAGFRNDADIIGIQLVAEPVTSEQKYPSTFKDLSETALAAFRVHTNKFFIYSPIVGGLNRDFNTVTPLDDDKIIYNFHGYAPAPYTHQGLYGNPNGVPFTDEQQAAEMAKFTLIEDFIARNNNIPVMCGAYSVVNYAKKDIDKWTQNIYTFLARNNIPSCYYAFNTWKGWDWRYTGVRAEDGTISYTKDLSTTNRLWTALTNYMKD